MKVLMVNKFLYPNGGSETYIFKIGKQLEQMGHEVQYFGMADERNIVGNDRGLYTGNMDFHTGKLKKLLYPFKIIYSREAGKKIRSLIQTIKPDVVHVNNISFQITPSILYEIKRAGIPVLWTLHDYQLICPNHMLYNMEKKEICSRCLEKGVRSCVRNRCIHGSLAKSLIGMIEACFYRILGTYRLVDQVIYPSQFMADQIRPCGIFKGEGVVLHNFVEEAEWQEPQKEDYVLYFGRYSQEKGIYTLVQAAQKLPDIPFVFAGSGPLEHLLEGTGNIRNVRFQSGRELEELIRKARFSVYPSEWYENCPFSVMESQLYGTPVIGADRGGIPELIMEGKTGCLFRSGEWEDLAAKIKWLWDEKDVQREYQLACRQIRFDTVEQYCKKLIRLYQKEDIGL